MISVSDVAKPVVLPRALTKRSVEALDGTLHWQLRIINGAEPAQEETQIVLAIYYATLSLKPRLPQREPTCTIEVRG